MMSVSKLWAMQAVTLSEFYHDNAVTTYGVDVILENNCYLLRGRYWYFTILALSFTTW